MHSLQHNIKNYQSSSFILSYCQRGKKASFLPSAVAGNRASISGAHRLFLFARLKCSLSSHLFSSSLQYDLFYVCQRCAEGCETCNDATACLSSYNWAFRVSLLTISILCIFFTGVLAGYIYKYRKLKVFKVASPIFLCITLLGCAIMYSEVSS